MTRRFLAALLLCITPALGAQEFDDFGLEEFRADPIRFSLDIKTIALAFDLSDSADMLGSDVDSIEGSAALSTRFKINGDPAPWISFEVHAQIEDDLVSNSAIRDLDSAIETEGRLFRGLDLETTWRETGRSRLWGEIDYANVHFNWEKTDLLIGRQAVTFGRSFFWNPIDWLSSFSPTEVDREYKNGVDAIRLTQSLGNFSGVELIYAYGDDGERENSAIIGRGFANFRGWDLELLAGDVLTDTRLGAAFSGDVGGAGLRGEISYHRPRKHSSAGPEEDFIRATLEWDYRWLNSLHLTSELHFNGFGSDQPEDYAALAASRRVATGQIPNLGRHYGALQLSGEITPLLTGSGAVLINLDDSSGLFNPSISYSLSDESRLDFGALVPWGEDRNGLEFESEYGAYVTTLWVQWRQTF